MTLNEHWQKICNEDRTPDEQNSFWSQYFEVEKDAYQTILAERNPIVEGTVVELADKLGVNKIQMIGFIDGINTSLEEEINLETLEDDTKITLKIEWDKLYVNMLAASAPWLYDLEEWDDIFTIEERMYMKKEFNKSRTAISNKVGRNEPCTCGSGLKFKKCCGK